MHIGVPTHCMTGGQQNNGYDQIPTAKYDADFYFFQASSVYWVSYLVGNIQRSQNNSGCTWSVSNAQLLSTFWNFFLLKILPLPIFLLDLLINDMP